MLLVVAAAAVSLIGVLSSASPAAAQGSRRPCGDPVMTSGHGSQGSPFTLKSMYDDNTAGQVVVGEEFEISNVPAGQVWTVVFTYDNTTVFFDGDSTATAAGIREVHMVLYQGGPSHLAAHAVSKVTGEVVHASVDLPVAPPRCGH
ncbi:MAG: hypothetical protein ACJ73S_09525 [Mycobacteriales bacterium]